LIIHQKICADAFTTLSTLVEKTNTVLSRKEDWLLLINGWKDILQKSQLPQEYKLEIGFIKPDIFFSALTKVARDPSNFVLDTGNTLGWFLNHFKIKPNQRIWHDFNNTAMGWSIPAAIGIGHACNNKLIVVIGDGSIMMTLGDLITLRAQHPNVKIIVVNNGGYSMIRQTQVQWFQSTFVGSSNRDLHFPIFEEIAKSTNFSYLKISSSSNLHESLDEAINCPAPVLIEVMIDPLEKLSPQVKFGKRLEDMDPPLPMHVMKKFDSLAKED
jgi:acetolactate synthase-1/2/3 large subunit